MIKARADAVLPATPDKIFAAVTDLAHADWLPAVRSSRHAGGPVTGIGARYEMEAGLTGRYAVGTLVCTEFDAPRHVAFQLEEGMHIHLAVDIEAIDGGSRVEIAAEYAVTGPVGGAIERALAGAARRETARAVEQLAAKFGRRTVEL